MRPNRDKTNLEEIVKNHYEKYADKYSFYESSMHFVYSYSMDPETNMWGMKDAIAAIDAIFQKGLFKKEDDYHFLRHALSIEQEGSASIMVKADFENKVKEYLDITAEHHVEEPSSLWFPVYAMKKK